MYSAYLRNVKDGHNKHYYVWVSRGWSNANPMHYNVMSAWGKIGNKPDYKIMHTCGTESEASQQAQKLCVMKKRRSYELRWDSHASPSVSISKWQDFRKLASVTRGELPYDRMVDPQTWPAGSVPSNVTKAPPPQSRPKKPKASKAAAPAPREKKTKKERMVRDDAEWNF